MSMEIARRIGKAVEEGRAARSAYYTAIALSDEQRLGPPAEESQLLKLEKQVEKSLPPSYRTFLQMFDGWRMAHGAVDLLSVEEMLEGPRSEMIRKWHSDAAKVGDSVAAESLVIGFSEVTSIKLLLDPNMVNDAGEWALVGHDNGVEWTNPSFLAWLEESAKNFAELARDEIAGDEDRE